MYNIHFGWNVTPAVCRYRGCVQMAIANEEEFKGETRRKRRQAGLSGGGSGRDAWWFWPRATVRYYSGWYSARLYYIIKYVACIPKVLYLVVSSAKIDTARDNAYVVSSYCYAPLQGVIGTQIILIITVHDTRWRLRCTGEVHTIIVFPGRKAHVADDTTPQAQNCRYIYARHLSSLIKL